MMSLMLGSLLPLEWQSDVTKQSTAPAASSRQPKPRMFVSSGEIRQQAQEQPVECIARAAGWQQKCRRFTDPWDSRA
jgi:hypothetical protein